MYFCLGKLEFIDFCVKVFHIFDSNPRLLNIWKNRKSKQPSTRRTARKGAEKYKNNKMWLKFWLKFIFFVVRRINDSNKSFKLGFLFTNISLFFNSCGGGKYNFRDPGKFSEKVKKSFKSVKLFPRLTSLLNSWKRLWAFTLNLSKIK